MAAKYEERPAETLRAANEATSFQKMQSPRHQRVAEHSAQQHSHHKKRRRSRESSGHESAPTINSSSSSTLAEYYGVGARVTRTAGITGLLTVSEQQIPHSPKSTSAAQARGQQQRQSPAHAVSSSSPGINHNSSVHKQEHMPLKSTVSAPANTEALAMPMKKPLPSDDVLNALFERLIEQLNLSAEKVAELNTKTPEQKWNLILAQHELQTGIACVFYIEQLVRHAQPELKEKKPKKKALENLQPLSKVLCDLEVDLRTNPNDSWVEEFVGSPNHGHVALIDLIKDLADSPYSVPRKNPQKYKVLERDPGHLHTSMLCLKSLMSQKHGFTAVLNYEASLCVLGYCFSSQTVSIRTRILILKIFVTVLVSPSGHKKVMQAFDYVRAIMKEKMRFQMMMASLTNEPVEPAYQAAALCFINTVVQTAQGSNAKVFHQHEFIQAGFSPEDIEKSLHGRQDERILHELKEWHNNFISVQKFMDDLAVAKGRIRSIQEELEQTQRHLHEANLDREALYERTKKLIEKYEIQRFSIEKLHKTIDQLLIIKVERDKLQEEKDLLMEVNSKYDYHIEELKNKVRLLMGELQSQKEGRSAGKAVQEQIKAFNLVDSSTQTIGSSTSTVSSFSRVEGTQNQGETANTVVTTTERSSSSSGSTAGPGTAASASPPAPPAVPDDGTLIPPPPPIPFGAPPVPPPPPIGGGMAPPGVPLKKPVVPNVLLPCLNWVPIRNPEHTIFKDLDDESVLETVDFSEFEALFQVKRFKKNAKLAKREDNTKKTAGQLQLIESRRARNLVIAKRRIGHSAEDVRDYILATDLDGLLPEYCELLLKFIPTQEELSELAKNASHVAQFGEAEQFMFQLAKIERYELRLNCMAYMGNFDELIGTTQPQIDAVLNASLSLFRSNRLRKVFEIILAFGNYMNSSRRGAVYGFKLESLSKLTDTKSHDRQLTLLNYIAHVVERVYPHVLSFYEDLDISEACKVSMQILQEDVQTLKDGMKTVHLEMKKETNNFIIFSFYNQAHKKVQHLGESFAKMEDAYREACLMFSESPKNIDPTDFFCLFQNFIKEWKKAVQENHTTQRRHMKSTNRLIKAQEDTDSSTAATEATAARGQHIQQETQKLTKKAESSHIIPNSKVGGASLPGGVTTVMQDPVEADVLDIHKRSAHQLQDVSNHHLPWHEQRTHRDNSERLTSPDSGVMDHLSEATESLDGTASSCIHSITSTSHPNTSKSHNVTTELAEDSLLLPVPPPPDMEGFQFGAPSHLQNGELPLVRDYPILPPPKDYPSLEQHLLPVASSSLAGDVYTVQEAKSNSRLPVKAKTKTHQGGAISMGSQTHSRPFYT